VRALLLSKVDIDVDIDLTSLLSVTYLSWLFGLEIRLEFNVGRLSMIVRAIFLNYCVCFLFSDDVYVKCAALLMMMLKHH
jgi:hypothetical protein